MTRQQETGFPYRTPKLPGLIMNKVSAVAPSVTISSNLNVALKVLQTPNTSAEMLKRIKREKLTNPSVHIFYSIKNRISILVIKIIILVFFFIWFLYFSLFL